MERISVLIPAYNEEKGIEKTIRSCLNQTRKPDEIIVVNDGSTDKTLEILKKYLGKIIIVNLKNNTGNKSKAQEIGLSFVTGDIFITADADTRLHFRFVEMIEKSFKKIGISAVCGFVESDKCNWITNVREIDYLVCQTIYKKAQAKIDAIFVLAGCASGFRTNDFRKIVTFDHDNITEDLDFTYKLKLANKKIIYNEKAIVYTQDPNNFKSYFRQIYRWYSGGWSCLRKNIKILRKPNNALILSLIYLEGLILGLLFILSPLLLVINFGLFIHILIADFILTSLCLIYGAIKFKRYNLFFYIPHHYFMHIANNIIFLYTFVKEIILNKRNLVWNRAERY
jgi:cellulose synthase/poly-beta-1,6-N-acetylglucosamine synthase-like glycosyltransferase